MVPSFHSRLNSFTAALITVVTLHSSLFAEAAIPTNTSKNDETIKSDSLSTSGDSLDSNKEASPNNNDFDNTSFGKFTFFISPLGLHLRPAGFSSFNTDAGVHFQNDIIVMDAAYEMALAGIESGFFRQADDANSVDRASIKTLYRSFETGAGWNFFRRWNNEDSRMTFYQVHAGAKSLKVPEISKRTDSLPLSTEKITNRYDSADVTLNSTIGMIFVGLGILHKKNGGTRRSTFRLYTDFLYAPTISYVAKSDIGTSYYGQTNALELQRYGGRIGIEGTESLKDYRFGLRWLVEAGIRPGVHDVNATFLSMYNAVQYSIYNLYLSARIGLCFSM